jgi:hypothetical protein
MVDLDSGEAFPELERLLRDGFLIPVPALDAQGRDATAIPTDWLDIQPLFRDMEQWIREHPQATLLCADDPGTQDTLDPGSSLGRIPRFGWVGYYTEDGVEHTRQWTITLADMKRTIRQASPEFERRLQTAQGRQEMLRQMMDYARPTPLEPEPKRKTLWERLQEE